jgi:hypothetical protein
MEVDQSTGEVLELVPLNLAELDEQQLAQMIPTPGQCALALVIARQRLARAPKVLNRLSKGVKDARRDLIIARGYARVEANGRDADTRKLVAESDARVISAHEALDDAELRLEYGRDLRKSLSEDIEILRSLNANFRTEHS